MDYISNKNIKCKAVFYDGNTEDILAKDWCLYCLND